MLEKFISYDGLPLKAGGAHSMSNADNLQVYLSMFSFFEELTNNPRSANILQLDLATKDEGSKAKFWNMVKFFGLPNWSFTGSRTGGFSWTFYVNEKQIPKAIELSKQFVNLTLTITWHFKFVNVNTKIILSGQDDIPVLDSRLGNSQVYMRLSQKITLSLWFVLPFDGLDGETIAYIKLIKARLPVKLSDNHWRIWTLSKNGNWTGRKLDVSITDVSKP